MLDRDTRARLRAARTKRLNRRLKPLDDLEAEVKAIQDRTDPGEDLLDRNDARVILQAQALRKEIQLAKQKVIEVERRLEEQDIAEEFEELKNALGVT
jgi:flagellar motility protein MotE (MotC chaperone)